MSKTLELTPEFKAYLDRVNEAIPSMLPQCKENIEGSKKILAEYMEGLKAKKNEWKQNLYIEYHPIYLYKGRFYRYTSSWLNILRH